MKEKIFKKGFTRKLFSIVLAMGMVFTLMPMNTLTVKAATKTVTITMDEVKEATDNSITKDGVTLTATDIDGMGKLKMGGSFTTSSGKITQIEIQGAMGIGMGDEWATQTGTTTVTKWTGSASSSVSFSGDIEPILDYTIVITIEESNTDGSNGGSDVTKKIWKGETSGITFTAPQSYGAFVDGGQVFIDDKLVDPVNYEAKSGSTIITLKQAFLDTLSQGPHSFRIAFGNGESFNAELIIDTASPASAPASAPASTTSPKTGDNSTNPGLLFIMISALILALGFSTKKRYDF